MARPAPKIPDRQPVQLDAKLNPFWLSRGLTNAVQTASRWDVCRRSFWTVTGTSTSVGAMDDHFGPTTTRYWTNSDVSHLSLSYAPDSSAYSTVAVISPSAYPSSGNGCIVWPDDPTGTGTGGEFHIDGSGHLQWTKPGYYDLVTGTTVIPINTVSYVGGVLGGPNRVELYYNGTTDASTTATYPTVGPKFVIGSVFNNSVYNFLGNIALVLIFNGVALSAGDMQLLTSNPWQVFAPIQRRRVYPGAAAGSNIKTPSRNIGQAVNRAGTY